MADKNFTCYNLDDKILKAIELLGYEEPTKVQSKVIPLALEGKDLIVKSQTGSGKTAAFGIPLCEKIDIEMKEPQALILSPTRELCLQTKEDISDIGRFKKVRCTAVFGKMPMRAQIRELRQRVHIVCGTPGRVMDHIRRGTLKLENIKYLIIDEADRMLDMGFIDQVDEIIDKLPKERITMLFSATMAGKIEKLCRKNMKNPVEVDITPENMVSKNIKQEYYEVKNNEKFRLLNKIISTENPESCIIFCSTKDRVDKLSQKLKDLNFSCDAFHGGLEQRDRLKVMKNFKKGNFNFLIATDIAARGLDVDDITLIINYDMPFECESYVHRIGRTGRAGKTGKAVTFATHNERKFLKDIEKYINLKITQKKVFLDKKMQKGKSIKAPDVEVCDKVALDEDITKIYINAGRKEKIRPGDILGAAASIKSVNGDDIGIIDVHDYFSYFDVLNGKGKLVLEALKHTTVKGKKVNAKLAQDMD